MILVADSKGRIASRKLFKPGVAYEFDPAGRFHELGRVRRSRPHASGKLVSLASGLKVWEGGSFDEDPADAAVRHRQEDDRNADLF